MNSGMSYSELIFPALSFFVVLLSIILFPFTKVPIDYFQGPLIIFFSYLFPLIVFGVFVLMAYRANMELKNDKQLTEAKITLKVDKYSGIVDGIGTALPLIGAALLLYYAVKPNSTEIFYGFAAPLEIKSIFLLAAAKLFESMFDSLAERYLTIVRSENDNAQLLEALKKRIVEFSNEDIVKLDSISQMANQNSESLNGFVNNLKDLSSLLGGKDQGSSNK
jgi:hypothetical protein